LHPVAEGRLDLHSGGRVAGVVRAAAPRGPGDDERLERLRGAGLVAVVVDAQGVVVHRFDAQGVVVGAEVFVDGGRPLPVDGDVGRVAPETRAPGHIFDPARQAVR